MSAAGRVWLTGAGPGHPDLLTVAARRIIDSADAIVYDRLVGPEILASIPPGTLRFDVGKAGYGRATRQEQIIELLIALAGRGLQVVRLKGGDPFVFGRGGEEALSLRAAGVQVDVIPGITAGIAGSALAGIPVTHRHIARTVAFVTGHSVAGQRPTAWQGIVGADTIVAYMAGRHANAVACSLVAAGRPAHTPVAVIVDASLPSQTVEVSDLASLEARGVREWAGRPTLLVIGDVVRLHSALGPAPAEAAI